MSQQQIERPRIFSHMTRSRFLHIEDALTPISPDKPGKIRFFIGSYKRGSGQPAVTAYHFLDANDARPLCLDMSWGRQVDIKDYKGSANGADGPISRVLKIKGPKAGKVWIEVQNGPGQIIGAGAVKPAGEPTASISIALTIWEARKLALAVAEYMLAWRVTTLAAAVKGGAPKVTGEAAFPIKPQSCPSTQPPMPKVKGETAPPPTNPRISANPRLDIDALFETEEPAQAKAQEEPPADNAPAFFNLVNEVLARKVLDLPAIQARIKAPGSWRDKGLELQAMLAA